MRLAGQEHHPTATSIMHNWAKLCHTTGDYAQATLVNEQALNNLRETDGEQHPRYAATLGNQAQVYLDMGNYAAARSFAEQALHIFQATFGDSHPQLASGLDGVAGVLWRTGDLSMARLCLKLALQMRRKIFGKQHPHVAFSLNNLACVCSDMGDFVEAEQLLNQALDIAQQLPGEQDESILITLNNLALLNSTLRRHGEAERLYGQALVICRGVLGEEHPKFATLLVHIGLICAATGRDNEALSLLEKAETVTDGTIGQVFSIGSENERMALLDSVQVSYFGFLSLVSRRLPGSPAAVRSAMDLVLRRKGVGGEALAVQRDAVLGNRYPELAPRLAELTALRQQIARATLAASDAAVASRETLTAWNHQREELEAGLARLIPEMNLARRLCAADRQAIAAALPSGSMLVEFVRCSIYFDFVVRPGAGVLVSKPARYLAFVLPADAPDDVRLVDLGDASSLDLLIEAFRAKITGETNDRAHVLGGHAGHSTGDVEFVEGTKLANALLGPLADVLTPWCWAAFSGTGWRPDATTV